MKPLFPPASGRARRLALALAVAVACAGLLSVFPDRGGVRPLEALSLAPDLPPDTVSPAPPTVSSTLRARVLYLNSYHQGYAWSDDILRGIRSVLDNHPDIEVQVEYQDFKKYELDHVRPLLVDLYARKFRDTHFDLVLVSDNNAYDFILDYGDHLFPGVPVVFCGVNDFRPERIAGRAITGVVENYDVAQTLALALRLHPGRRRVVTIGDLSGTGLAILNQVRDGAATFGGRLEFEAWTQFSLEEIRARVRETPADTFYYFIPFYQSVGGRFASAQEVLGIVRAHTDAPMYSSWEFLLGHGIVGGKLISGREHGRRAAGMALKLLSGVPMADLPVIYDAETHYGFDYNELRRQDIPYEELPGDSVIINEPQAFYELDKEVFWTLMVSFALLLGISVLLAMNIMRRREAERTMHDQLSFQEILMDTIPQLVCWKDRQQRYLGANRYFSEFFGIDEVPGVRGRTDEVLLPPREFAAWATERDRDVIRTERPMRRARKQVHNARGEARVLEIRKVPLRDKRGAVVGTLSTAEDVTREANLERQLLQSQKMEAIGTLAGGIAHDFNNILTSIINSTELALMDIDPESAAGQDLERCLRAARRGSGLVKQILTFSRPSQEGFQPTAIQEVLRDALGLLKASLPRNIEIVSHVREDLPPVMADPAQINQIVMNLTTNAFHALRETGGRMEVRLDVAELDPSAAELRNVAPGCYLRLQVLDNGPGVSPAIVDKIFDPFFTTKGKAEGTGLGLAVVMGIIKGHRGSIEVESAPRERTAFTVHIPVTDTDGLPRAQLPAGTHTGSGHLLFVEDDEDQFQTIPRVLESLGYTVTPARDAREALEAVDGDPEGFDAVITDFDMPGLSGVELARELERRMPDVPVLMVSGRERAVALAAGLSNVARILLKPYDRNTLSEALREVLQTDDD
ncbi:hybrid sensor histidine kinase/response regulator [Desulfocurvus vexinensis]|uniref:hybrid sensor histidine kinase/response regulator n=1 Tax=Desulfocurvus vexinensis TaxID=399548 RepID=UPI0004B201EF|nr:ATP-binding protein [Desulfocurvus vexinensis]